jgi:hypothetical protein
MVEGMEEIVLQERSGDSKRSCGTPVAVSLALGAPRSSHIRNTHKAEAVF